MSAVSVQEDYSDVSQALVIGKRVVVSTIKLFLTFTIGLKA